MPTQSPRSNRMRKPLALRSTKAMSISAKAMSADVGAAAAVARELAPRSRSRTGRRLNGAAIRSRTAQLVRAAGCEVPSRKRSPEHDDFGLVRSASPAVVMPRGGGASSSHGGRLCLLDRPLSRAKTILRADSTSIRPALAAWRDRGCRGWRP
jgi:hypothetical protein